MRILLMASLIVVAIIHLLPLLGVAGQERLQALYGISLTDPDVVLLLRHRAVLFGMLGAYFVAAAFKPALQLSALVIGATSVVSFLALALAGGPPSAAIGRIVVADWVALVAIIAGFVAYWRLPG